MSSDNRIIIFDTTLRDGEQALPQSLSARQKLQIALALEELGVDVLEAGFPISSKGDFESVSQIAATLKKRSPAACRVALQRISRRPEKPSESRNASAFILSLPRARFTCAISCASPLTTSLKWPRLP